jgi:diguanylate cyclase (GGDEF)-like protein
MKHQKYMHIYKNCKQKNIKKELLAENKRLHSEITELERRCIMLGEQAILDPLTGAYNRRYMDSILTPEHIQAKQGGVPLSIVMLDMDNLKKINDMFGHAIGDTALRTLGKKLREMTRTEDIVCRYGGDEFVVFLHNVSTETAYKRAEEWRRAMEESPIMYQNTKIRITITAGIATHKVHANTIAKTINAADEALYWAKNMGRNLVSIADTMNRTLYSLPRNFLAVTH